MSPPDAAPAAPDAGAPWPGPFIRYDLVKELVVALGVVTLLAIVLTVLFSSPDDSPTTIQSWAQADPGDFLTTATTELSGTSELAEYGPPYNHTPDATQKIGPLDLQSAPGVRIPIDTAKDFVIDPLKEIPASPRLKVALATYQAAPPALQEAWTGAYEGALEKARIVRGVPVLPAGRYGPVAPMMAALLGLAQSGGLDGALLGEQRPLLPDQLHQAAALPLRRRLLRGTRRRPAPARRPVGNDERDRQLPRPGLALALHLLVPDRTVQGIAQRGRC